MKRLQSGFTLIEIAIVMVIIGLLLGGVLKGQELIRSGRIKNIANDLRAMATAIHAYQDRYKVLPGDDPKAQQHHGGTDCNGECANGMIDAEWNATAGGGDESTLVWQHLRRAGFLKGSGDQQPNHALGGMIGVTGSQSLHGMENVNRLVLGNLPGDVAAALDTELDDGLADGGAMLGMEAAENPQTGYEREKRYEVVSWRF